MNGDSVEDHCLDFVSKNCFKLNENQKDLSNEEIVDEHSTSNANSNTTSLGSALTAKKSNKNQSDDLSVMKKMLEDETDSLKSNLIICFFFHTKRDRKVWFDNSFLNWCLSLLLVDDFFLILRYIGRLK